jgi:hypothetical protein
MVKIALGDWDDVPVVTGNGDAEAWYFDDTDNKWHPADEGEVLTKAKPVSPESFLTLFGELPPLPDEAF